ncbi:hypothetical protein NLG97_g4626 [Lecanicillium saksenae]|uniref:Uncharacterized protein n=1 Tax=Lecanicillium saksenae TaxID=468837 RepID=A0ACC1QUY2_9HYPO|nr:hypothetical protein NLG97_g4626 [Lecanicillium saksenae]
MLLTIQERASLLIKAVLVLPPRLAFYILRAVIHAVVWRMSIRNAIACGYVRAGFTTLSPRQLQHVVPSTRQRYQNFVRCQAEKYPEGSLGVSFTPEIEPLDTSNSALLWLGNRQKATKIVYFLHGGGFIVPLSPGHLRWCWDLYIKPSAAAGIDIACAILEYTLSPDAIYPNHLRQATLGLQAILDQGFSPEDIIVGGDSAGGSLTMQLLMHIKHPNPEVPLLSLDGRFAAIFLVSAWLTHRAPRLPSFHKYLNCDLSPSGPRVEHLQSQVAGTTNVMPELETKYWWGTPLDATPGKWEGLGDIFQHIFVTYGEYEVLANHSEELIQLLKEHCPEVDVVVDIGHREAHDTVVLEGITHQQDGPGSRRLQQWFSRFLDGYYDSGIKT